MRKRQEDIPVPLASVSRSFFVADLYSVTDSTISTDSIDEDLTKFLKKYFPKETREKQIAIETADGVEQFGMYYRHPSEYKCAVM